jgi:hypothetical protein
MVMTIVRWTLVIVGTAAYLGLAILGWGGWTAFFSHPARVALAVALAVMAGVSLFAGGNLSPGLREDRGNRWVHARVGGSDRPGGPRRLAAQRSRGHATGTASGAR